MRQSAEVDRFRPLHRLIPDREWVLLPGLDLMASIGTKPGPVLIVEDDDESRELLGLVVSRRGYEVRTAANGSEALGALRGGLRPFLILLDQTMPVMDGFEFRTRQQADPVLRSIPVVIISGLPVPSRMSQGTVAVLAKPVDVDLLLRLLRHYSTASDASAAG